MVDLFQQLAKFLPISGKRLVCGFLLHMCLVYIICILIARWLTADAAWGQKIF